MDNQNFEAYLNTDNESPQPPKVPLTIFFLLGNASLLAYNIAINAIDIFSPLFSDLNINIGADLSRSYNIPSCIIAFILIFIKPRNFRVAIIAGLTILILIMCIMAVIFSIDSLKEKVRTLYWLVVLIIGCTAVCSSMLLSTSYAFASQCGEKAGASVSSGNGCCGVIAASLRIITKVSLSKNEEASSIIYYSVAAVILLCTTVYFIVVTGRDENIRCLLIQQNKPMNTMLPSIKQLVETIKIIWIQWVSVALNFIITLTLFPGYTTDIRQGKLGNWSFVLVTTAFCIFDWMGRFLPSVFLFPVRKFAWIPIVCRLAFFPVFMISIQGVCNCGEPYWSICWQIPFALTNGYFGTLNLIYGSNNENCSLEQRKQASFLISFAINVGILIAMLLTYAMPDGKHLD